MAYTEHLYCGTCPLRDLCYGAESEVPEKVEVNREKECVLLKLKWGELRVRLSGFVENN